MSTSTFDYPPFENREGWGSRVSGKVKGGPAPRDKIRNLDRRRERSGVATLYINEPKRVSMMRVSRFGDKGQNLGTDGTFPSFSPNLDYRNQKQLEADAPARQIPASSASPLWRRKLGNVPSVPGFPPEHQRGIIFSGFPVGNE
jgi:hypothetical protein